MRICSVFVFLCGLLAAEVRAQQVYCPTLLGSQRLFPEVFLAARADWYRPDLAAQRVKTVTRTFGMHSGWQPLGDARRLQEAGSAAYDSLREVLSYSPAGHLLRYTFTLTRGKGLTKRPQLVNDFQYNSAAQLTAIEISGSPVLTETDEQLSLDAYLSLNHANKPIGGSGIGLHWVQGNQNNRLQALSLRSIRFTPNATGRAGLPLATLWLRSSTTNWLDTVRLDPRRGFGLVSRTATDLRADSAWLKPSGQWLVQEVAPVATSPIRLQHLTDYFRSSVASRAYEGLTSFFDAAGHLRASRSSAQGEISCYDYGSRGEVVKAVTYKLLLPQQRPPLELFGQPNDPHYLIVDCEGLQRQWLPISNDKKAVLQQQLIQQVQYLKAPNGLVKQAIVHNIDPVYIPDIQLAFESTVTALGHNGPFVHVKHWRRIQARAKRTEKYLAAGCVPMKTTDDASHVVTFKYTFFK